MPPADIVMGLKGQLDYYVWRGLVVVRAWPRKPLMPRSPAVTAQYTVMGDLLHRFALAAPAYLEASRLAAKGTPWMPRDAAIRAAYGNLILPPL